MQLKPQGLTCVTKVNFKSKKKKRAR